MGGFMKNLAIKTCWYLLELVFTEIQNLAKIKAVQSIEKSASIFIKIIQLIENEYFNSLSNKQDFLNEITQSDEKFAQWVKSQDEINISADYQGFAWFCESVYLYMLDLRARIAEDEIKLEKYKSIFDLLNTFHNLPKVIQSYYLGKRSAENVLETEESYFKNSLIFQQLQNKYNFRFDIDKVNI
jgi:hypothetical protein